MKKGFPASTLKYIAVAAMVIDHLAWIYVSSESNLPLYIICHAIGRLTFPIMAYFCAVGFERTLNIKGYLTRMLIFAACAIPGYYLFEVQILGGPTTRMNVIFTLLFGVLALHLCSRVSSPLIKAVIVILAAWLSSPFDWGMIGVLLIVFFYFCRNFKNRFAAIFVPILLMCLVQKLRELQIVYQNGYTLLYLLEPPRLMIFFTLLAVPLLFAYNGEKGNSPRYFFYIFYPAHLIVIYLLYIAINQL